MFSAGTPDLYCVMGNPVAHSRSPWIHARFAALTGQHLRYEHHLVALDAFSHGLRDFIDQGGRGCNVTVPFKLDAALAADCSSQRVQLAGAANTLRVEPDGRIYADNTDGLGLVTDILCNAKVVLAGMDILLIGAGGAAAGALGPLLEQKPRSITVCNRTVSRAAELVHRHMNLAGMQQVQLMAHSPQTLQGSFDIVINATATSLQGSGIPVPGSVLRPGSLAYDMMYGIAAQPFLNWAKQYQATGRDGLGMLVEQAAESFALWRNVRPPSQQVLAELRAALVPEQETKSSNADFNTTA